MKATPWIWTDARDGKRWLVQMIPLRVIGRWPRWRIIFSDARNSTQLSTELQSEGGKPSEEEMEELLDRARRAGEVG